MNWYCCEIFNRPIADRERRKPSNELCSTVTWSKFKQETQIYNHWPQWYTVDPPVHGAMVLVPSLASDCISGLNSCLKHDQVNVETRFIASFALCFINYWIFNRPNSGNSFNRYVLNLETATIIGLYGHCGPITYAFIDEDHQYGRKAWPLWTGLAMATMDWCIATC